MIAFDDHFKLATTDLKKILEAALSRGGDFAEIYGEYRHFSFINMEEDIIKETAEAISLGLGVRVVSGDKTGYGYTNDLSLDKIRRAVLTAAAIASGTGAKSLPRFQRVRVKGDPYPVKEPFHKTNLSQKIDLVKKAYLACQKSSLKIKKVKVGLQDHIRQVFIVNSAGIMARDIRPQVRLICAAIAEKGKRREIGFSGGGGRVGLEYFRDVLTAERIGKEAAQDALTLLEAVEAPAGEMPVVLAPGHSGVLVHEAVGHLLEADFNRKKTSIFWNKLGKKVGSELISITDDPTIPSFRGSYAVDDEGTVPRKTLLIEKGRVVSFLQDRLSARLMGMPLTGHGRRQDYTCIPIPRMSNTYIEKGQDDPGDIIRSVSKGIYAEKFEGGQVEDSGKFTFSISSGHLIEAGRMTAPIKQATLIGTNIDILRKIVMVGSDLSFGLQTGTCSKEGQEVPVTDGCPTIKISRMTVGGKS
ncbi:MAG: TldD/PmbA family protein [Clostridiales bacterium]|nr:TldD/PmbA family protein [Clostridiales bacterium]